MISKITDCFRRSSGDNFCCQNFQHSTLYDKQQETKKVAVNVEAPYQGFDPIYFYSGA